MDKQYVLNQVQNLNHPNQPFYYVVEGDEIVGRWKWMDARFFVPNGISDETKQYELRIKLDEKGKWHEKDKTINKSTNIDLKNGKITFGTNNFSGATTSKQFEFGFGKDKQSDQTGAIGFYLDTNMIKEPVRNFLKNMGYKKSIF